MRVARPGLVDFSEERKQEALQFDNFYSRLHSDRRSRSD